MHDMKLKHKLLISHLILVFAPILIITAMFYNQLFKTIVANTKSSELSIARETVTNIDNTITEIKNISNIIESSEVFQTLLRHETPMKAKNEKYKDLLIFSEQIDAMVDGNTISDIKIYLSEDYQECLSDEGLSKFNIYHPISNIRNSYWHGIFASTNYKTLFCPTLYLSSKEVNESGQLSYTIKITDSKNIEIAYVSIYFKRAMINTLLKKYTTLPGSAKYILNERDAIVGYTNRNLVGEYLVDYDDIPPLVPDVNKFEEKSFSSERTYISYLEIPETNWIMIFVIPVDSIWSENKLLLLEFIIAYLVVLAFVLFVSLSLSNSIVRRISDVIATMKTVKTGKPTSLSHPAEQDEIGDLIETYNFMIEEINELSDQQIKAASELRTAEFKALQAQINPHFLYNTLDMINWLAKKGLNDEVSEAVQTLSKFYKMTLRKGNITVTLEEELEHVSLYIQLQNMRYDNKIHFTVDVPDNMLEYTIPKITFQPIVENAILHGILGKESKEGNIVITGWIEEDTLVFLISDDGIGIPDEKVHQLFAGKFESKKGSGIAISNVHSRLQLFYDTKFGLSYRSMVGKYTEVEIRIPATL
jgi:two-component system sensor histidine kinase YesM